MDPKSMNGNEIVISGIAGKFPKANNIKEYQENLLNGIDCITEKNIRWNVDHPNIPQKTGVIEGVNKCDSIFFSIHARAAHQMEPMMRMMLERTYEAVIDAGINPRTLKGKKTGVFMASSWSDDERIVMYGRLKNEQNGLVIAGVARAMFANRVTFFMGLTGPSYNIDTGCTASLAALEQACSAIKDGVCENAIVGTAFLTLHPHMALQLSRLGVVALDGKTKSFSDNASGYALSEAISVIFLQKASDAKRIYAEVMSVQSMHGPSVPTNSVLFPSSEFQEQLMKQTLKKAKISGKEISFVEADGLGIKDADAREAKAIDHVYNEGRDSPLLIGSVKSNIGHASSTNGISSIIKVIIAMETGIIPANLHFENPSNLIPALSNGRLKVVTKPTAWQGTYAAINSTSFTGNAAHVILKAFKKKKTKEERIHNLPKIMTVSGRTKEAVEMILDDLENRPVDIEMLQLLSDIFEIDTYSHLYRGYTLLPPHGLVKTKQRQIEHCPTRNREVWFIFSGMGSQWVGMGESLLHLPVFSEAVRKCDAVLKPRGYDIYKILVDKDPKMFDNIIHSFLGIATVQIGLTDVLKSLGIKPDFMIGHSVGELGCAYADGCFTAEEMVLSALCRGLASVESTLIKGSMAAVGLGYEEVKYLCPSDIDVACHNSSTSSTISGPAESMKKFIKELQDKNIFAREVAVSNIAYHSRYIAPAGPKLLKYLKEIIKTPKPRSTRWICSSAPRQDWLLAKCLLSSAEYHTNNLLSPVLFAECSQIIPDNSITIEIAPHGLLQAILKRSLPKNCINIPLTSRIHKNNIDFFLTSLGKLYNAGLQPQIKNLYPKVEYPVGRGTPSISSLLKWDHSLDLFTDFYNPVKKSASGERTFQIDLSKDEWKFLKGHNVNGNIVIPSSLYLSLTLEIAKSLYEKILLVIFENVNIHQHQVIIPIKGFIALTVMLQKGTGKFEVMSNDRLLASGIIKIEDTLHERIQIPEIVNNNQEELFKVDLYTEFCMRGLQYSDSFMNIMKFSLNKDMGVISNKKNLTILLDSMIQLYVLGNDVRILQCPVKIQKIIIDVQQLEASEFNSQENFVQISQKYNMLKSNEVDIIGITLQTVLPETINFETDCSQSTPTCYSPRNCSNWSASLIKENNFKMITWIESPPLSDLEIKSLAKVEYSSIHPQDLNPSKEYLSSDVTEKSMFTIKKYGLEFSGIDTEGNQIMGISQSGTLSKYAFIHPEFTWSIPQTWTLEDAATVPLSYAIAYGALCLYKISNWYSLEDEVSVLIMDGSSSYSQAAINIAQHKEWKIFTTYVTEEERTIIHTCYPQIPDSHLCCAQKMDFRDQLLLETKGEGVSIVFCNNCNLEILDIYLSCIKKGGHFVIVGELDNAIYKSVGMAIFREEIIFSAFNLKKLFSDELEIKRILSSMIKEGIKTGAVVPLHHKVYNRDMIQTAFADVASKRNFGSTVIKVLSENGNKELAIPRFYAIRSKTYIIIEGMSTIGFELIDFLVARNARNIVVTSSSQNDKNYYKLRQSFWNKNGIVVMIRKNLDLSVKKNCTNLLTETTAMGPVDGIFDLQRFTSTNSLKTQNLCLKVVNEESRRVNPYLRYFIVCSKRNNLNDKIEEDEAVELCKQRVADGLPGIFVTCVDIDNFEVENISTDMGKPTIFKYIEQLDKITEEDTHVIQISLQATTKDKKMTGNTSVEAEETEATKFHKYIYQTDEDKNYLARPLDSLL